MATPQPAILDRAMGKNQWFLHFTLETGADLDQIRRVLKAYRKQCGATGVKTVIGLGSSLMPMLTDEVPADFFAFEPIESIDGSGRRAVATQHDLVLWLHSNNTGDVWKAQFEARQGFKGHLKAGRESLTFIYKSSLDLSGFIDGTGNPEPTRDVEVAIVPDSEPGAGGSHMLAQRWEHDLEAFRGLPIEEQEAIFGRRKSDSVRLDVQPPTSHLAHVELREGQTADETKPKRNEISRRSTPYAIHDGRVGLYFVAFCREQEPFRERLRSMYGCNGEPRDKLTDYSNPATGAFYFAPSVEVLDKITE